MLEYARVLGGGAKVSGVVTLKEKFKISYSKEPVKNVMFVDFSQYCKENSIPIYVMQENMHEKALVEKLRIWKPDIIVVVGWYHIIPEEIRSIPKLGAVGFHASLLPKYRGCAPLVWAMIQGEREVGLSLFVLDEGVDTGALIAQAKIPVLMKDTIAAVYKKVEEAGLEILRTDFWDYVYGKRKLLPQVILDEGRRGWPARNPKDGLFSWKTMSPLGIYNYIRAQTHPYPGAYCYCGDDKITIWKATLYPYEYEGYKAGEIIKQIDDRDFQGVLIATADNDIPILIENISINDNEKNKEEMFSYFSTVGVCSLN